jgi:coenzyme PQQ precursor peptide PqqA
MGRRSLRVLSAKPFSSAKPPVLLPGQKLAPFSKRPYLFSRRSYRNTEETVMAWKTPKIVEVPVGMEINMYACAARQ